MIPCIIATARTGSSYISYLMYEIGKDKFQYKNYLNEYFTVQELFQADYEKIDNVVQLIFSKRTNAKWFDDARKIKLDRLNLLKNDTSYAFKIFAEDIEPEIDNYITKNFTPIFLERRNKIDQFISFSHMLSTNTASYDIDDNAVINEITVKQEHIQLFFNHIKNYTRYKNNYKGRSKTLYYEDFMNSEDQIEFIAKILNVVNFPEDIFFNSKKTPYIDEPESLIANKTEWACIKMILKHVLQNVK